GEQAWLAAVERDLEQLPIVRVQARGAGHALEPHGAVVGVHVHDLGDVAVAGGHRVLRLAAGGVVQVQVAPAVALAPPQDLVRLRQVAPVDRVDAALEPGRHVLVQHLAHGAGGDVGDPQPDVLVVARAGREREGPAVRRPLHVLPAAEAADVVALGGAVLVRRHLQPHHGTGRDVDDHALDHGDVLVADQRVLPALDLWVADHGLHQHHLAGPALVLLEGRDLRRVGRPHQDRAVAVGPAGVVGGVAVVGAAIGGEPGFLARGDVAHPQVPVADEGLRLAVRRAHAGLLAAL